MVQKRDKILEVILLILIIFISETYMINAFSYGIRINPGIKVGNLTNNSTNPSVSNNSNMNNNPSSNSNNSNNNQNHSQIFQNDSKAINNNKDFTNSSDESNSYSENSNIDNKNTENANTLFLNKNSGEAVDKQNNKQSDSSQKTLENPINKKNIKSSVIESHNINENLIFVLGEMTFLFTMILISLTSYAYVAREFENQIYLRKVQSLSVKDYI